MREVDVDVRSQGGAAAAGSAGAVASPSRGANRDHCLFCFDVLHAKLSGQRLPEATFADRDESYPLFVTWNTVLSRGGHRLRGCIGNFEAQHLGEGLKEYAMIAALRDHRFPPVLLKELPKLHCGVSLLTCFEECKDPYDWDVGVHGIYIHLYDTVPGKDSRGRSPLRRRSRSSSTASSSARSLLRRGPGILTATFLPDVPPNQGWDHVETLNAAIRKAGWNDEIDDAVRASLYVVRYQSTKAEVAYDTWLHERSSS